MASVEGGPGNSARGRRLFGADVQLPAGLAVLMMAGMNGTNLRDAWVVDVVREALKDERAEDVATTAAQAEALLESVRDAAARMAPRIMSTNEHTPEATRGEAAWQEMVWRQAFNAFLSAVPRETWSETLDATIAESCAHMADAALVEWKKRWQR